jgi:hypothetical protein
VIPRKSQFNGHWTTSQNNLDHQAQSKPCSYETAEIRQKIAGGVHEHERKQIFRSRPDYAKGDSAHSQDDDRIGNGVQRTWTRTKAFQFTSVTKDKPGSVRQTKYDGHEHDTAYLGFECSGKLRLNQTAKEKFFDESCFKQKPHEAERKTDEQLKSGKVFTSKRCAAAADEVLKSKESSANRENDKQMISAQRTQALSLNPEIAKSITETESKNREGNNNENE